MNQTYQLVILAKEKGGIISDYEIAKKIGVSRHMLSNWKNEKSEASAINTLKLIKEAGLNIDDAIQLMTKPEVERTKQNGSVSLFLVTLIAMVSITYCLKINIFDISQLATCYTKLNLTSRQHPQT